MKRSPLKRTSGLKRGGNQLKRTPLKKVSKKQSKILSEYRKVRREIEKERGDNCEVRGCRNQFDHHHHIEPTGAGGSKTEKSNIILVCFSCHDRIHYGSPSWARKEGYLK